MSAKHYFRNVAGTLELQTLVPREGWEVKSAAEEGSTPIVSIAIPDPEMALDFTGHRRWLIIEDESEDTDDVLYMGYTADQEIGRTGGEFVEPLGRVWVISIADANSLWGRRVMTGSDCKRPAETDVERMQWLLATNEASPWFENVTDYVATGSSVSMDKGDYRGQMFNAIADDCAQASGKNWFVAYINNGVDRELCAFYGSYTYDSPLSLSNDPADWDDADLADGTSLVYPISFDAKLKRDPSRVFTGNYLAYEGGAVYRTRAATETAFALGGRDMISPSTNVKTKAKAIARANRQLLDVKDQDERISGSAVVPKGKATMIKAGMRVRVKATHMPGYEAFVWMRVLSCTPAPQDAGTRYKLNLELQGPGTRALVCSTALGAIEVVSANANGTGPPVTSTITPTIDGRIIAINFAGGVNTPNANTIDAISGGYTELLNEPDISRSTYRVAHKAASAGVSATATSTSYTRSFANADSWWSIQLAMQTAATSPVQTKYANSGHIITLDAAPTPGNILIAFRSCDSAGFGVPDTSGWTTLFDGSFATHQVQVKVFARCVQAGDTDVITFTAAGSSISQSQFVMEWEITE